MVSDQPGRRFLRVFVAGNGPRRDLAQAAEPGALALGELAGSRLHTLHGFLDRRPAGEQVDDLGVAHALRGDRPERARGIHQCTDFFNQSLFKHLNDPSIDPRAEFISGAIQGEDRHARRRRAIVIGLEGAEGLSGGLGHFQGTDHPAAIVGMEPCGRGGIDRREPGVQGRVATLFGLGFELFSE